MNKIVALMLIVCLALAIVACDDDRKAVDGSRPDVGTTDSSTETTGNDPSETTGNDPSETTGSQNTQETTGGANNADWGGANTEEWGEYYPIGGKK